MVTRKDFEEMKSGEVFETVALVKSYEERPTKTGGKYMNGMLEMKGTVPFKVWSGALFDELEKYEYQGMVCQITAKVDVYNDMKSLIVTGVKALEEGTYKIEDFFEDRYNTQAYMDAMDKLMSDKCSPEIVKLYTEIMDSVRDRFMVEFAARSHHDAFKGGLLAHTYRVTSIMWRTVKFYEHLMGKVDMDLLFLGCVFHDIGKVKEYTSGVIMGNGLLVSHHTFGVEILSGYKDRIVEVKDEEFYYRLLAIVEQHHGEFEETPRCLEAYLVHIFDITESRLQILNESIEKGESPIRIDSFRLN